MLVASVIFYQQLYFAEMKSFPCSLPLVVIFICVSTQLGTAIPVNSSLHTSQQPVDVKIYKTGNSYNYAAFASTKDGLAQAALSVFSKLPSDKSKTNFTWVAYQLDPFYAPTKSCNASAFQEACGILGVTSFILTYSNDTLPLGWVSTVAMLAKAGLDNIHHFSKYGCVAASKGSISVSPYGLDIIPSDLHCAPNDDQSPLLSSSNSSSLVLKDDEDYTTAKCFKTNYIARFKGPCLMETGLPEMAFLLGFFPYARRAIYKPLKIRQSLRRELTEKEMSLRVKISSNGNLEENANNLDEAICSINRETSGRVKIQDCVKEMGVKDGEAFGERSVEELEKRIAVSKIRLGAIKSDIYHASQYLSRKQKANVDLLQSVLEETQNLENEYSYRSKEEAKEFIEDRQGTTPPETGAESAEAKFSSDATSFNKECAERLFKIHNHYLSTGKLTYDNLKIGSGCDPSRVNDGELLAREQIEDPKELSLNKYAVKTEYEAFGDNVGSPTC